PGRGAHGPRAARAPSALARLRLLHLPQGRIARLVDRVLRGRGVSGADSHSQVALDELQARVSEAMREGPFSEETTTRMGELMGRFVTFAREGFAIERANEVTPAIAEGFVRARARDGALPAVATMHLRRATARLLFAEGRRLGLVAHDPTMDLRLPP